MKRARTDDQQSHVTNEPTNADPGHPWTRVRKFMWRDPDGYTRGAPVLTQLRPWTDAEINAVQAYIDIGDEDSAVRVRDGRQAGHIRHRLEFHPHIIYTYPPHIWSVVMRYERETYQQEMWIVADRLRRKTVKRILNGTRFK